MQYIVVTTINPPNNLYGSYADKTNKACIVIGDKKTPMDWSFPGVNFINIDNQEQLGYSIAKYLPYSHYSRKNIGYIYAKLNGAKSIVDTDDDNFPTSNWAYPIESPNYDLTSENLGFLNVYELFSSDFCWPRGFPLDEIIPSKGKLKSSILKKQSETPKVGIWQGLVNGDADFDAIYRLTHERKDFLFLERDPVILSPGCYCPINSQTTFFVEELFSLLYLPISVSFRFTDILRGYIAEVICYRKGFLLGFCSPNVWQVRNEHNLFCDFQDELSVYQYSKQVVDIAESEILASESIEDNLARVYRELAKHNIVADNELFALDAFLRDMT